MSLCYDYWCKPHHRYENTEWFPEGACRSFADVDAEQKASLSRASDPPALHVRVLEWLGFRVSP